MTLAATITGLLTIAASVKEHHKLSPIQAEILSTLKDVDETTLLNWSKYLAAILKSGDGTDMVSIYLKRGGMHNKQKFNRLGVVTFKSYREFKDSTDPKTPIHGVKMRVKDREAIVKLYEHLLPGIDREDGYNVGSNSDIAPYMEALMCAFGGVAVQLNDTLNLFKNRIEGAEDLMFEMDWADAFSSLGTMLTEIRSVPMQSGNEGSLRTQPQPEPVVAQAPQQLAQPVQMAAPVVNAPQMQPAYQQPVPQQVKSPSEGVDVAAMMRQRGIGGAYMNQLPPELARQQMIQAQGPISGYPQGGWPQQQPQYMIPPQYSPTQGMVPGFQQPPQQLQYPQQYPQQYGYVQQPMVNQPYGRF